jgi:hypothetical protein
VGGDLLDFGSSLDIFRLVNIPKIHWKEYGRSLSQCFASKIMLLNITHQGYFHDLSGNVHPCSFFFPYLVTFLIPARTCS